MALADGSIELNVKADAASSALPAAARPVLGERAVLSAAIKRNAKGLVSADSIKLVSGAVSADGSASLHDGQIVAELKGALADLSLLSKEAKGAIGLSVTAKGVMVAPDVTLSVSGDKLEVAGREIQGLNLTASGRADAANPAADISLSGTVAGQPLQGKAVLKTANGQRRIDGLSLALGQNGVSGDLVLDQAFLPEGLVKIDLPDIGPLAALALEKAEGNVRGMVRFSKQDGVPQLALQAKAGLKRGDLTANNVAIDAQVATRGGARRGWHGSCGCRDFRNHDRDRHRHRPEARRRMDWLFRRRHGQGHSGEGGGTGQGRRRYDDARTRFRPGYDPRPQGSDRRAVHHRCRQRHHDDPEAGGGRRGRPRHGQRHCRQRAGPQRRAGQFADRRRQCFLAGPRCRRYRFGHCEGDWPRVGAVGGL